MKNNHHIFIILLTLFSTKFVFSADKSHEQKDGVSKIAVTLSPEQIMNHFQAGVEVPLQAKDIHKTISSGPWRDRGEIDNRNLFSGEKLFNDVLNGIGLGDFNTEFELAKQLTGKNISFRQLESKIYYAACKFGQKNGPSEDEQDSIKNGVYSKAMAALVEVMHPQEATLNTSFLSGDTSVPPFPTSDSFQDGAKKMSIEDVEKIYFNGFFKDGWTIPVNANEIHKAIMGSYGCNWLNRYSYQAGEYCLGKTLKQAGLKEYDDIFRMSQQLGAGPVTARQLHREVYNSVSAWALMSSSVKSEQASIRDKMYGHVMSALIPSMRSDHF